MNTAFEILHYQASDGRVPFRQWLDTVTDSIGYAAIQVRKDRLARGLFGDCEPVGDGVWELNRHRAGLPRVLRALRQAGRAAALRGRQAIAEVGHQESENVLERL